jgi:hypothetical protein
MKWKFAIHLCGTQFALIKKQTTCLRSGHFTTQALLLDIAEKFLSTGFVLARIIFRLPANVVQALNRPGRYKV